MGNVRLSYTDTNGNNAIVATEVIEESNYYPFGLQHKGYNNIVSIQNGNSTAQKWKYNDTEYNDAFSMNMYEMPLRGYDPALGRWTTIDPVTHYSTSTYNGYDNNPVFWADPSGGNVIQNDNGWEFNGADAGAAFNAYLGMMDTGQGQFQLQGEYFDMTGIFELPEVGVSGSGGTLNGLGEIVQNHTYAHSPFYQNVNSNTTSSVGQPGTWESMIPVWGSGRAAVDHFQNGNWVEGSLYTALAVSDLFLVKSVFTGLAKGGLKLAGSHSWGATRKYYLKEGFAKPYKPLHHWLIHQRGPVGKHVPDAIKNQMWNLKSFNSASMHMRAGHGTSFYGKKGYGMMGQIWYGTPDWPKLLIGSYGGRGIGELAD